MKVAISGATGFVGTRLVARLQAEGDAIVVLTRDEARGRRTFPQSTFPNVQIQTYTPQASGEWQKAIATCDAVINLAGAAIADERWTSDRKQEILNSRTLTTQKLVEAIAQADPKPQVLINASAIGYYGTSETATFDETSPTGDDFLASVSQAWEAEAQKVKDLGVRLVILRLGIVLGEGGVLAKMIPPFKLFAGGPLGSGRQWFSWIHREDLVNLILFSLRQSNVQGVLNATAPNPIRMSELCDNLGQVLGRPSWLPVPGVVLDVLLGDAAKLVLEGQQVLPKRTLDYEFKYQYPTIQGALSEILQ